MNNVVVTVLYLLRALYQRIIVYCIFSEIQKINDAHKRVCLSRNFKLNDIARPMYVNKQSDCLLSRAHGLIAYFGFFLFTTVECNVAHMIICSITLGLR